MLSLLISIPALIVYGLIIIMVLTFCLWKKAPQDKAIVITGLKKRVLIGSGGFVIPVLEQTDRISLRNITIDVDTRGSLDCHAVPINTDGVAIVKIKNTPESVLLAMEQFHKDNEESTIEKMQKMVKEVLEGKLREILSTLTIEEIYKDRQKFADKVEENAKKDLANMGLDIIAFTIKGISDENGYLDSLGAKQIAIVRRDAAIAQAEATREQTEKTSEAYKVGQEAQLKAETEIAKAQKDKELKIQEFIAEQEQAKAKANFAYKVEENVIQKQVVSAEKEAVLVEETKLTQIAEQQAKTKEFELESSVRKIAEADKYKKELEADVLKNRIIKEAEADAEAIKIKGEVEADIIRLRGEATADALKAETEAIEKKAQVYQKYGQAVLIENVIKVLPELAKNVAAPMSSISNMTVIDNGGEGGAKKVTKNVTDLMSEIPSIVKALTGVDIINTLAAFSNVELKNDSDKVIEPNKIEEVSEK